MTKPLTFTGERFLPELGGEISYEHWHRYALAAQLSPGCTVLDIACGEGYGSALLAHHANKVIGVDISREAVEHAQTQYQNLKNLEFSQGSCEKIPVPDQSIDLAVSFETIEHIEAQQQFILELKRVLKPNGMLIMSSPNKRLYSDAHDYHNEFHVRELYREEFEAVLKDQFPCIRWFGQKLMFHSAIWPESVEFEGLDYFLKTASEVKEVQHPAMEAMYFLVICSGEVDALSSIENTLSLFSESGESVYKDYANQTRRVMHLDELLGNRDRIIVERDELLATRTGQMEELERIIAERDELLEMRTGQMEELERLITERDELLEMRTGQMEERERRIEERDELLTLRTQQMEERDAMLAELRQQLERSNAELLGRDKQLGDQLTRLNDNKAKLKHNEAQLADLRDSAQQLEERLTVQQQQITMLESELGNKTEQVEQQDEHLVKRKHQVDELEIELSKRADWIAALDKQILELSERTKAQTEELDNRQRRLAEQEITNQQQRKVIESLESEVIYRESLGWWLKLPWRLISGRHNRSK